MVRGLSNEIMMICVILSALVGIVSVLLFMNYMHYKASTKSWDEDDLESRNGFDPNWKVESFHHLEFDVDEIFNLDERNLIGSGGTGKSLSNEAKKERCNRRC